MAKRYTVCMAGDDPEAGYPVNAHTADEAALIAAPKLFEPNDPLESFDVFVFPVFSDDGERFTVLVDGLRVRFDEADGSRDTESAIFTVKRYVPQIALAPVPAPQAL